MTPSRHSTLPGCDVLVVVHAAGAPAPPPPAGVSLHLDGEAVRVLAGAGAVQGDAPGGGVAVCRLVSRDRAGSVTLDATTGAPDGDDPADREAAATRIAWNTVTGTLSARRDTAGAFPIYYATVEGGAAVATSLPLLRRFVETSAGALAVDRAALIQYATLGYPVRPRTAWRGIQALPAGWAWSMDLGAGRAALEEIWQPAERVRPERLGLAEAAARLRDRTERAVRARLPADRPVGCFLSGGIDSTTVLALAVRLGRHPVHSYSVGYEAGARSAKYNVDLEVARRVAAELGSRHREVIVPGDDRILDAIRRAARACGEPVGAPSVVPTSRLLGEATGDGIDVLLSGDGFDESFGGTERYRVERLAEALRAGMPPALRRLLGRTALAPIARRSLMDRYLPRYLSWEPVFTGAEVGRLLGASPEEITEALGPVESRLEAVAGARHVVDAMMDWQVRQAEPTLHPYRYSAHYAALSARVRCPLLDRRVLELGYALPVSLRAPLWGPRKPVVRRAFADLLPAATRDRPPWGFLPPYFHWLHLPAVRDYAREVLPGAAARVGVDAGAGGAMLDEFYRGGTPTQDKVWRLLTLLAWGDAGV